jgi:hypothetical protein
VATSLPSGETGTSGAAGQQDDAGMWAWVGLGIGLCVLLVLVMIVAVVVLRRRKAKAREDANDLETHDLSDVWKTADVPNSFNAGANGVAASGARSSEYASAASVFLDDSKASLNSGAGAGPSSIVYGSAASLLAPKPDVITYSTFDQSASNNSLPPITYGALK